MTDKELVKALADCLEKITSNVMVVQWLPGTEMDKALELIEQAKEMANTKGVKKS